MNTKTINKTIRHYLEYELYHYKYYIDELEKLRNNYKHYQDRQTLVDQQLINILELADTTKMLGMARIVEAITYTLNYSQSFMTLYDNVYEKNLYFPDVANTNELWNRSNWYNVRNQLLLVLAYELGIPDDYNEMLPKNISRKF